jgi:hypothetical protein
MEVRPGSAEQRCTLHRVRDTVQGFGFSRYARPGMTTRRSPMHLPAITATYLAVLALLYAALGLRVIRLRRPSQSTC